MGGLRGFDGNKQLVGRERPSLVETPGVLLSGVVHAAGVPDRTGGRWVLQATGDAFPRVRHSWAEHGSPGTLVRWAEQEHGWTVQVVSPGNRHLTRYAPDGLADLGSASGFHVIPKRWIAERTFSWFGRQRRVRKDDERLPSTAESFISLVGIRLLLARLAPA